MPDLPPVAGNRIPAEPFRSKGPESVGKRAKLATAEMRGGGQDVPRNAQGKAASAIARGLSPENLFAARVSDQQGPAALQKTNDVSADREPAGDARTADADPIDIDLSEEQIAGFLALEAMSDNLRRREDGT